MEPVESAKSVVPAEPVDAAKSVVPAEPVDAAMSVGSAGPVVPVEHRALSHRHSQRPDTYRIVSLCPSNTELVCALGLEEYLVGVDNYSDYPPDFVDALPRLGPDLQIDIDAVVRLQPHLVISSLSVPGMEKVVDGIETAGLPQIALSPHNFQDIYADLALIADSVPDDVLSVDEAKKIIDDLRVRVSRVQDWTMEHVDPAERPKLYWEWWPNPVFSPGRLNWLTEVSRLAGARNIFGDEDADSVQDDGQRIHAADPDWFLAVWTGVPQHKVPLKKILSRDDVWQQTTAFRQQNMLVLSEGLFCRPSQRLVDGLEQLVGLLHPAAISDLGLRLPHEYGPVRRMDGSWMV